MKNKSNPQPDPEFIPNPDGPIIQRMLRVATGSPEDVTIIHNLYKKYISANAPAPITNCNCALSVGVYFNEIKKYYLNNLDKFK